ncbi:portal protein [Kluyvera ascorbata]|uniref:portal protein n=1 Tax=Kluyvera ascorbata TaxID=51288 RepID=UPI00289B6869|nr:portal protein [Kluyvera ascorbata]
MQIVQINKQRKHKGQFTQQQLLKLMGDIDGQPDWRSDANTAAAYYDGDQLPPQVIQVLQQRGQPPECQNLIAPAIDSVLGTEAKTRSDLRVEANYQNDKTEELAEALNAEFYTVCQEMRIDRTRSDAYAEQVKSGLSWVEVRRNPDVTGTRYIAETVNRNEVYWDWTSRRPDLRDCRWLMRKRWMDLDEAVMLFPQRAEVLKCAVGNLWDDFVDTERLDGTDSDLEKGWGEKQNWSRQESEYMSVGRDRLMLYVIYYRVYERIPMMELPTGKFIEYDKDNIAHAVAVGSGRVKVTMQLVSFIREAWFAGPYHLGDRQCDAPQGMFPLVPFWGFRKDKNGIPYGLVSRMISAQNSYNFRHLKITWLLQAKQIIMDSDAVNMTVAQVREEANRPDGVLILNPDRQNKKTTAETLQISSDSSVSQQQMQIMEYDRQNIQDCAGIYSSYMGQDSNAISGIAVSNLVEQSSTTLAEINDNYTMACNALGELTLNYLLEDMGKRTDYKIVINRKDKRRRKVVTVNIRGDDGMITNDITRLDARIVLAPIDSTPAYRAQLADRLIGIIQKLPPQAQSAVIDLVLELVEIPNKDEFVDRVSRAMGAQDPNYMTDEEKQQAQQQAKINEFAQALQFKAQIADIQNKDADTANKQASANKSQATADGQKYSDGLTMAQTGQIMQQMEMNQQQIAAMGQQMEALQKLVVQLVTSGARLELDG